MLVRLVRLRVVQNWRSNICYTVIPSWKFTWKSQYWSISNVSSGLFRGRAGCQWAVNIRSSTLRARAKLCGPRQLRNLHSSNKSAQLWFELEVAIVKSWTRIKVRYLMLAIRGVPDRCGRSHFFRLRFRSYFKIFESGYWSGSSNFSNLRIWLLFRRRLQSSFQLNFPMFLLKKCPHRLLLLPKLKSDSGSGIGFSQIFYSGSGSEA